jgi:hypothetical protein
MQSYFGHIYLPKSNKIKSNPLTVKDCLEEEFELIEGVRLFIDGDNFWLEASLYLFGLEKYNLIKGAFSGLGYVTLIECNVKGFTNSVGGNEGKLSINFILCGVQIGKEDDLYFSSLSIKMPSLKKWVNKTVFKGSLIGDEKMTIEYPETINFGDFDKFSLEAFFGINQNIDNQKTIILKDYVTLKIKAANSNLSLWEFLEIYKKFKKFLVFINVFDNNPDFFTFLENDTKYEHIDYPIQLKFYMSSFNFKNKGIDEIKTPKFENVRENIITILQNWFLKSEIFDSVNLILEKYFQANLSKETFFLNSCFAVEIYHRRFKKNYKLPSSEFKKLKKSIIAKLETPLEIDFFKEKLSYANEPSFRERLNSLKEEFYWILSDNIDLDDFIKKVVLTRNYIVHRSSSKDTVSGLELYYTSVYIEALTKICIFKELGFSHEDIQTMFSNSRDQIESMFNLNKRLQAGIKKS